MSAREWFEGDLAIVTTKSGREYRAVYTLAPGIDYFWRQIDNERLRGKLTDPDVTARPLATIDPENEEQVERLTRLLREQSEKWLPPGAPTKSEVQRALREFANPTPPKPDEPTGLGAVVEDADGDFWVYVGNRTAMSDTRIWQHARKELVFDEIAAVRILSAGVES